MLRIQRETTAPEILVHTTPLPSPPIEGAGLAVAYYLCKDGMVKVLKDEREKLSLVSLLTNSNIQGTMPLPTRELSCGE